MNGKNKPFISSAILIKIRDLDFELEEELQSHRRLNYYEHTIIESNAILYPKLHQWLLNNHAINEYALNYYVGILLE